MVSSSPVPSPLPVLAPAMLPSRAPRQTTEMIHRTRAGCPSPSLVFACAPARESCRLASGLLDSPQKHGQRQALSSLLRRPASRRRPAARRTPCPAREKLPHCSWRPLAGRPSFGPQTQESLRWFASPRRGRAAHPTPGRGDSRLSRHAPLVTATLPTGRAPLTRERKQPLPHLCSGVPSIPARADAPLCMR